MWPARLTSLTVVWVFALLASGCSGRLLLTTSDEAAACDACPTCAATCAATCPSRCDGGDPGGDASGTDGDTAGDGATDTDDGDGLDGDSDSTGDDDPTDPSDLDPSDGDDVLPGDGDADGGDGGDTDTCLNDRCGSSALCCPDDRSVCMYGRYCQPACPHPTDERCGVTGELCCDTTAQQTCGSSLACVRNCAVGEQLCGNGTPGSYGTSCCAAGQVCAFDECRTPTNACESFVDCGAGEYCELVLDPPGCGLTSTCDTEGLCLPDVAPPGTEDCQGRPTDLFEPIFEWHWLGATEEPGCTSGSVCTGAPCTDYGSSSCYKNVLVSPVVMDMDRATEPALIWKSPVSGKVFDFASGRYPEVVIKAYGAGDYLNDARIVILDGRTGETKRLIGGDRGGYGHPTIGNLDGDAKLELVNLEDTGVRVFDPFYDATASPAETNTAWSRTSGSLNISFKGGAPLLTDFNGDGAAELVVRGVVLDGATGAVRCDLGAIESDNHNDGAIVAVADLDLDSLPELVIGSRAFDIGESGGVWTCAAKWDAWATIGGGYPGVANFVDNRIAPWNTLVPSGANPALDYPEVVVVRDGDVAILHGFDGSLMKGPDGVTNAKFDLFGSRGGPPNIADFDGDGRAEVSFAGSGCMVVVDLDCTVGATARNGATLPDGCAIDPDDVQRCTSEAGANIATMVGILWMDRTQDESSAITGTSVFDFQGDGKAEVLYNDECFFRVYDGETGSVLMEQPNSTRTASEYPIVVDVDGDKNSEILVAANNDQNSRDCCAGGPAAICDQERPTQNGLMSYWRSSDSASSDYFDYLSLYDASYCTCGHLKSQGACDARSGCAWNTVAASCGVFDCSALVDSVGCEATTGCDWSGSCSVVACSGFVDRDTCNAAVPCTWTGSACAQRPNRPDDPADVCVNGTWGLWSFGDQEARWVQTLPHWHEHTYHVTEIDLDGNPVADWGPGQNNWDVYNNLRQNVQGYAPLNQPDLIVFSFVASGAQCPTIRLNARIVNRGRAGIAAGVPIAFYVVPAGSSTPVEIGRVPLPYALLPGLGADVSFDYTPPNPASLLFIVVANPSEGSTPVAECLTDNNQATTVSLSCNDEG